MITNADVFDRHALIQAREARGWTLRELSRRSGVSPGSLSGYENGANAPGLAALVMLARALGIPPSRLMKA